jgi:hypothetical protein
MNECRLQRRRFVNRKHWSHFLYIGYLFEDNAVVARPYLLTVFFWISVSVDTEIIVNYTYSKLNELLLKRDQFECVISQVSY